MVTAAQTQTMNELRDRLSHVENIVGIDDPRDDDAGSLSLQTMVNGESLESLNRAHLDWVKTVENQFLSLSDQLRTSTMAVKDLENEIVILKRALANPQQSDRGDGATTSKVRVPEPKPFEGARNAKELENFLWDMEQYFKAVRVPEAEQVTVTSMYLTGDAKLWWRSRLDDDMSSGRPLIETWETLKKELKDQFLPCNTAWLARESLKKLRHTSTVREYVKEFSSLMLDIKNMSDDDKLFNFMSGLQPWA